MYTTFDPHFTAVVETGLAVAWSKVRGAIQDDDVALARRRVR